MRETILTLGLAAFIGFTFQAIAQDNSSRSNERRPSQTRPDEKENFSPNSVAAECRHNKTFLSRKFEINCEENFHHYKSKSRSRGRRSSPKKIRVGEFNVLHPGMNKTRFKDYNKVAKIIDQYDLVGVTELIPLVSVDLKNNENVLDFIHDAPFMIEQTEVEIEVLEEDIASSRRGREEKRIELRLLKKKLEELKSDQEDAASLYRKPGYLKILEELQKLPGGKTWTLILQPRGEGSETTSTPELVGYYYRSDLVEPKDNSYCKSVNKTSNPLAYACIVNMDKIDLGTDKSSLFARRPFLAQFKAGSFEFVALTSHILYDSPTEENRMQSILRAVFGVNDHSVLGEGLRKSNYARFAEVKMTLEFITRYKRRFKDVKDIIYLGDFNLRSGNPFWKNILPSWRGSKLFIKSPTSLKEQYADSDGNPSGGLSSNYDHFIFDPQETSECMKSDGKLNGGSVNFMQGSLGRSIDRKYRVRYKYNGRGNIRTNSRKYDSLMERFVEPYFDGRENIVTIGRKYVTVGRYRKISRGIIIDERATEDYGVLFQERILDSQLDLDSFYYFYEQLVSDHLPIFMDCEI